MTTVEFSDTKGNRIGTVTVTDDGQLRADPWLESVAAAWRAQGHSGAEFAQHYDGWSNGQATGRIRSEENSVATTPKLGSGARFKKFAAQAANDDAPPAPTARKKKFGGSPFARLAAKKQQSK